MNARRVWGAVVLGVVCLLTAAGARAEVRALDTQAVRTLLDREGGEVFLLDVRTPGEYRRGHIPGAVLIPMNEVPARLREIPRDKKIVVVCASGARSAAVARFLDGRGYPWVANYTGGVFDWARAGLPLDR
ncbi:MAG: rhodanese-like domain-containing protein [Candidatus Dadabacteria bacterium]|nr:MAG: rhodanese-like domain-containing protein [Candidatus Dadabacteria bacterium]